MPLLAVFDDVGWWSGANDSDCGGPFRTGIGRDHCVADYHALADLGKRLGMRVQAAMILCEWDHQDILRELPTATWMGKAWDNSRWRGPWLDEAAHVLRANAPYIEIVLHGVGHEYWEDGVMTRAEWEDMNGHMRPRDQIERHVDYFGRLMEMNGLGPFPVSFVPAAFRYTYSGDCSAMAGLLARCGVRYVSTPFRMMTGAELVKGRLYGDEDGVMTVDRGSDPIGWDSIGKCPTGDIPDPICGLHWPNILHPNPERNGENVDAWAKLLQGIGARPDRVLSADTRACWTQLAYHENAKTRVDRNTIVVSLEGARGIQRKILNDWFYIKVSCADALEFSSDDLEIRSVTRDQANGTYLAALSHSEGEFSEGHVRFDQHRQADSGHDHTDQPARHQGKQAAGRSDFDA